MFFILRNIIHLTACGNIYLGLLSEVDKFHESMDLPQLAVNMAANLKCFPNARALIAIVLYVKKNLLPSNHSSGTKKILHIYGLESTGKTTLLKFFDNFLPCRKISEMSEDKYQYWFNLENKNPDQLILWDD